MALFEARLLLLYVLVLPNSSTQLHQCFHDPWGAFGHILKEWRTFPSPSQRPTAPIWWLGQIWHFDPLGSAFTPPVRLGASQFFYAVASMFSWPMGSLWAYIEGMVDLSLPFTATNSSNLAPGPDLALWPSLKDVYSSSMFWCFPILLRSCINVFMTHEEHLGIY